MMQFSMFENDRTLGFDITGGATGRIGGGVSGGATGRIGGGVSGGATGRVQSGMRTVHIRVSGSVHASTLLGMSNSRVQSVLNSKGWQVTGVTTVASAFYPGQAITWEVRANVYTSSSDSQIVNQIRFDLADYINVLQVAIVRSSPATYVGGNVGGSMNAGGGDNSGGVPTWLGGDNSGGFGSSFGMGLGVSTPIMLGVGALVLVLALRR